MKSHFFTGLAILLPIALTLWILIFLVTALTNPFLEFVEGVLRYYNVLDRPFLFFTDQDVVIFWSRILILLFLIGLTMLIGFFARLFFIKSLFKYGDALLHRIPVVNKIYKAAKEIIHTLFGHKRTSFSQVVLIPYPNERSYALGLLASHQQPAASSVDQRDKMSIFVPGAPNPTFGFMVLYPKEKVILLDMKVDDALKYIVSCGVLDTPFNIKPQSG
jgi:uncharacterized membrane protein